MSKSEIIGKAVIAVIAGIVIFASLLLLVHPIATNVVSVVQEGLDHWSSLPELDGIPDNGQLTNNDLMWFIFFGIGIIAILIAIALTVVASGKRLRCILGIHDEQIVVKKPRYADADEVVLYNKCFCCKTELKTSAINLRIAKNKNDDLMFVIKKTDYYDF